MRTTRRLWHSVFGMLFVATGATAAPSETSSPENIYSQYDPDGVPLSVTQPQDRKLTPAEIDELHRQQNQAAQNRNWLLRNYEQEQQLLNRGKGTSDQSANLYLQISSNKALAKLAGLPEVDPNSASLKTGADSEASGATLRNDPTLQAARSLPSISNLSRPLISPLSSTPSLSAFAAPLPLTMSSPILPEPTSPSATPAGQIQETADLETPGMTAEKRDPLEGMSSADLTLDILPGESVEEARAHQDNFQAQLALPMDANQLHEQQAAITKPLTAAKPATDKTAQPTPPPAPTQPEDDPNAPMPITQVPQINPVRPAIPSPFDILHR